jgi:hypothetical protein
MQNTNEQSILRWVVLAVSILAVAKLWQSARNLFWTAFGVGWVLYWTGGLSFF